MQEGSCTETSRRQTSSSARSSRASRASRAQGACLVSRTPPSLLSLRLFVVHTPAYAPLSTPRLVDFGLSVRLEGLGAEGGEHAGEGGGAAAAVRTTFQAEQRVGVYEYMSPEVFSTRSLNLGLATPGSDSRLRLSLQPRRRCSTAVRSGRASTRTPSGCCSTARSRRRSRSRPWRSSGATLPRRPLRGRAQTASSPGSPRPPSRRTGRLPSPSW